MLDSFVTYYSKAKKKQELSYQGILWNKEDIDDDLIWHVPIYDVVNRRFAAFSSFTEAIWYKENDPKGNGIFFKETSIDQEDFIVMCYLFRLCGSGINYKPKQNGLFQEPFGTHGFGNFWIVNQIHKGIKDHKDWIENIPNEKFSDSKGYLLPMIKGGLRKFIIEKSLYLIDYILSNIEGEKVSIKEVVDIGNEWLIGNGFQRQNFVLTAFSMDLAEYFPEKVCRDSEVYVGSNAKKCLNMILPNMKDDNKKLRYLCDITGNHSKPYDMEDVACDFIRYINNFQSDHHIKINNGNTYKNNL